MYRRALLAAVVLMGVVAGGCGRGPEAATPKDALRGFAAALEKGDVSQAASYCTDKELAEAVVKLEIKRRELEKALDKRYGARKGGGMTVRGLAALTPADVDSGKLTIKEDGDQATVTLSSGGPEVELVRKGGAWRIAPAGADLTDEQRKNALRMAREVDSAFKSAMAKVGKEGVTRANVEWAFVGRLMGAALSEAKRRSEEKVPPETEKAIRAAVDRLAKALEDLSVEALKPVVAEQCMVRGSTRVLQLCDASYVKYLKSSGQSFRIDSIEKVVCPAPGNASVQVKVSATRPYGKETATEWIFLRKGAAGWQLVAAAGDSLLFPPNLSARPLRLADLPTASSIASWTPQQTEAWKKWAVGKRLEARAHVRRVTEVGGKGSGQYEVEMRYPSDSMLAHMGSSITEVFSIEAWTSAPDAARFKKGWSATVAGVIRDVRVKVSRIEAPFNKQKDKRVEYSIVLWDGKGTPPGKGAPPATPSPDVKAGPARSPKGAIRAPRAQSGEAQSGRRNPGRHDLTASRMASDMIDGEGGGPSAA